MRQKKQRDEGGGANWMDTYGDLVTLLLCFFVMLFASSTMNEEKWIAIIESFRGQPTGSVIEAIDVAAPTQGFSDSDMINSPQQEMSQEELDALNEQQAEADKSEEQQEIESEFNALYEQLQSYISTEGLNETILLQKDGLYIYLTIAEGILFDSGDASIRDEVGEQALADISMMIQRHLDSINLIIVEGHTDTDPIQTAAFQDNRDLSAIRANNVIRFMEERGGITDQYFRAYGASYYEPIATNDTTEGKQKNRRVNIILMAKNVDEIAAEMSQFDVIQGVAAGEQEEAVTLTTQSNQIRETGEAEGGADEAT